MSINKQSNQTRWLVGAFFIGLLLLSNCKRDSTNTTAGNSSTLPGLSQPIRVSSGDADAAEPAIAASPDGSVYVVWVNHSQGAGADVMVARFNGDGQMQGSAARVNPQPETATAWRGDPPTIVVAPDHTVFVGWTARVNSESGHTNDLYLSSSRDHAQTFAAPTKVNDDSKPAGHGMHSLVVGKDGHVYVAWLDERNIAPMAAKDTELAANTKGHHVESNSEVFMASSTDGRSFSANKRVATNACPCCKTALAIADDGRVYLSWRQVLPGDFRHIAVTSSIDQGRTFTEPRIVSDDQWMLAGCPVSGSNMVVSDDGTLHVLWYSAGKNGETGLYSSKSEDHGNSFDPRILLANGETRGTPVLLKYGKRLTAVWEDGLGQVMTGSLGVPEESVSLRIPSSTLPAAIETAKHLFVAYIAKKDEHQSVWMVSAKRKPAT